jgi:hypothetical protein
MMKVQKVAYWKLDVPYYITDGYWGRRGGGLDAVAEELGLEDLQDALFESQSLAQEAAQLLLVKWDEMWGWVDDNRDFREAGLDTRAVKKEFFNSSDCVTLSRGGEVRERRVSKVMKTVTVEGEEYKREVEVVELGEWEYRPGLDQNIRVGVYRHEISILTGE